MKTASVMTNERSFWGTLFVPNAPKTHFWHTFRAQKESSFFGHGIRAGLFEKSKRPARFFMNYFKFRARFSSMISNFGRTFLVSYFRAHSPKMSAYYRTHMATSRVKIQINGVWVSLGGYRFSCQLQNNRPRLFVVPFFFFFRGHVSDVFEPLLCVPRHLKICVRNIDHAKFTTLFRHGICDEDIHRTCLDTRGDFYFSTFGNLPKDKSNEQHSAHETRKTILSYERMPGGVSEYAFTQTLFQFIYRPREIPSLQAI